MRFSFTLVRQYYEKIVKLLSYKVKFTFVSEETVLKLLKDRGENKAAGLDNLSGNFFKQGATVSAKSTSQICNFSIKYSIFTSDCKIMKLKPV